ncbi:MAG: HEAT repeat domain-containing protein [Fidelibacterota bacterium]|nr:MAG: HEAT repeat domain-containing protein [Candidatus Neomarinimicrobiota bacterium]
MGIPYLKELILKDQIFVFLAGTIAVSLVLVVLFALFTIYLRLRNIRRAEHWRRMETGWEPAILDFLARERTQDEIRQLVGPNESFYFLDFLLRFAQRIRGEEATALHQLAEPYLPALVLRIQKGDPPRRARAVLTLSALGLERYSEAIVTALDDQSPLVAMIAARALAERDHPEHALAILERLHRFENWSQNYLASMLTSMGPEASPALRKTLLDPGRNPWVRAVAADALRSLNDLEAGDLVARVLETETDRDLLAASLRLLREVGSPEHLEPVRRLCLSSDFVIRAQALRVLGSLGSPEDLPLFGAGMEDETPWVALQAARGLLAVGGEYMLRKLAVADLPGSELARQVLVEGGAA